MSAEILDGKKVAVNIKNHIADQIKNLLKAGEEPPKLAVITVGSDKAALSYGASKRKACASVGIVSEEISFYEDVSEKELISTISDLNNNSAINGIMICLPLPKHISQEAVSKAIAPEKDVDCFNPVNFGRLFLGDPLFCPCTPAGAAEILKFYNIPTEGKSALVIGRSNIVGKPAAALLTQMNATVTLAHSKTKNLPELCRQADIIIAAIGKPEFIKGSWIKEGAVVIDVGINALDDPSAPKGFRLTGDVEFSEASKQAGFITPVPGGCGPVTTAVLLRNTLKSRLQGQI